MILYVGASLALLAGVNGVRNTQPNLQARSLDNHKFARQLPANATGLKTITTPQNVTIRYKEPGKEGVCETTPGVNSYSGYIDLDVGFRMIRSQIKMTDGWIGKLTHVLLVLRSKE